MLDNFLFNKDFYITNRDYDKGKKPFLALRIYQLYTTYLKPHK